MKKLLIMVLVLGTLAGCQRYSGGKPVEPVEAKEEIKQEVKKEPKKEDNKQAELDQQATDDLKKYFDENFSETSWYPYIEKIRVVKNRALIDTNVIKSNTGKQAVDNMDNTVWGYTNMDKSKYRFEEVTVFDKDGKVILIEHNPLIK